MNLDALTRDQNPHWFDPRFRFSEADWFKRGIYNELKTAVEKDLIVTLTGLRRVGKSTLVKQVLSSLLTKHPARNVLYFSFDQSVVKNEPETLRSILETYATSILHRPLGKASTSIFIFLDEIQIIPYWQDIIKTYYDLSPNLKFVLTGSSSLFIKTKSAESLAGRLREFIVPPLSFTEYLELNVEAKVEIEKTGLEKYSSFFPEYLGTYFEKFLAGGQFPQAVKNNYPQGQIKEYLGTIEDKIIEIDLPRAFLVKRPDILKIIFSYIKESSGSLVSYENLTNDLGIDVRTTIKYIEWLKKAYLLDFCLNQTKKRVKSSRTAKKIYLTSTNFGQNLDIGSLVETYIYNFLKRTGLRVEFFRFQNREIDFITTNSKGQMIPWEVKYRENIKKNDVKEVKIFAKNRRSPYGFVITKNMEDQRKIDNILVYYIPASKIELAGKALSDKLI